MTEKMARAGAAAARPTTFGDLILLTQPINDDLNPYWRLKNGMVLPREREETRLSSGSQYGRVMQSRRKAYDRAMGLDYVIRNFSLMIKERGKKTIELASYILPKMSDYYYIADRKEGSGYRFKYLWYYRNRGTRRVAGGVGKGWNFRMADRDWSLKLLTGYHTGIATFAPVSQSLYGSVTTRPEYVSKFKILIKPGLNVYVVNYVYHRDEPYIFVRRLDLKEGSPVSDKKSKLTLVETHTVYGSD
jgi:hypothetical protein